MEIKQDKWQRNVYEDICSEVFHVYDNQKHDPMYTEKLKLINECQKLVGNDIFLKSPLNIAVIGHPGCGKSSFLNTVFTSFNTDSWRELAPVGLFNLDGQQLHVTERFRSYTKKDYCRFSKDADSLMPTFLDMTGFSDEQSDHILNLLELVFSGRIREKEKIADIVHLSADAANKFNKEVKHRPVDRIIVVSTLEPDSNLPLDLMNAIVKAARKNRDIPIYGVLTGRDKYDPIRNKKVNEKVIKFRQVLGLPKHRYACITNYCEDSDPDMKYLKTTIPRFDVPVLQLMKQVLTPVTIDKDASDMPIHLQILIRSIVIVLFSLCFVTMIIHKITG